MSRHCLTWVVWQVSLPGSVTQFSTSFFKHSVSTVSEQTYSDTSWQLVLGTWLTTGTRITLQLLTSSGFTTSLSSNRQTLLQIVLQGAGTPAQAAPVRQTSRQVNRSILSVAT